MWVVLVRYSSEISRRIHYFCEQRLLSSGSENNLSASEPPPSGVPRVHCGRRGSGSVLEFDLAAALQRSFQQEPRHLGNAIGNKCGKDGNGGTLCGGDARHFVKQDRMQDDIHNDVNDVNAV